MILVVYRLCIVCVVIGLLSIVLSASAFIALILKR